VPVPSAVGGRRTGGTSCAFSSVLRSNSSSILLKPNRTVVRRSNGSRLSCGALVKDSFPNLRAPAASSAC